MSASSLKSSAADVEFLRTYFNEIYIGVWGRGGGFIL